MINPCDRQKPLNPRLWLPVAVGLFLLLISSVQAQQNHHVLLVASKDLPIYQKVINSFDKHLNPDGLHSSALMSPQTLTAASLNQYDLIITIGTEAARSVLALPADKPILSVLIPQSTFTTLTEQQQTRLQSRQISAIYLEQPFWRQLRLLQQINPDVKRLGTVLGPSSANEQPALETAVANMQWQLNLNHLNKDDNPIEVLTPVIGHSDAFLAVPDRAIFNRSTAKWILLMSFRQQIPLIAYSKRYVDAGAIAAVYSTPETVGWEAADWVNRFSFERLPEPAYPQRFDVSVNPATARSLRLSLPSLAAIREAIASP